MKKKFVLSLLVVVSILLLTGCGTKYTQEEVDQAVTNAKSGMHTQEEVDQAVANATFGMHTQEEFEQAVQNIKSGMYTQEEVDQAVANATLGLYTSEEVQQKIDQAVELAPSTGGCTPVDKPAPDWAVITVEKDGNTWEEYGYYRADYDQMLVEIVLEESLSIVKEEGSSTASVSVPDTWYVAVFFDGGEWQGSLGNPAILDGNEIFPGREVTFTFFGNISSGVRIVSAEKYDVLEQYIEDFKNHETS
jgi:uncharacterized protein YceK